MARRSDHNRQELMDLAVEDACIIVEVDGFRALTARNVGDAISYSPGTLYNLFEGLDDIVIRLNGRTLDKLFVHLTRDPLTGVPDTDIRRLLDAYLDFVERHPNLWSTLLEHTMTEGRQRPDWCERKIADLLQLLADALSPLFPRNGKTATRVAHILWASLHGICSLSYMNKMELVTTLPVREMAVTLITNFVTGLKVQYASN